MKVQDRRLLLYRAGVAASLLFVLLLPGSTWADSYSSGVSAYKQGNYAKAAQLFQASVQENPDDASRMFYLGLARTRENRLNDARQAFEAVIQMVPPSDPLAAKARNNISVLTEQQIIKVSSNEKADAIIRAAHSRSSRANYLTHVIPGGQVIHFDPARMPLKVYIGDGGSVPGWTPEMKSVVTDAMTAWRSASGGKVSFQRVYKESEADIVVRWRHRFSDNILGVSPYQIRGSTLVHSDISLATYYPDSTVPIPMQELQAIALHEMGHAIGLKGHSPYPQDIMYYSKNRSQQSVTERDRNTIAMLYGVEADVKNAGMSSAASGKYFELLDKGVAAYKQQQTAAAMNYLRQAVGLNATQPEAKYLLALMVHDEGVRYGQQGNLTQARSHFQEATRLLQQVVGTPGAPQEARSVLNAAQKNLSAMNAR